MMMVKRGMGESNTFSQRIADEIDHAINMSGRSVSDVITEAGMSRNYYYKRLRGEMPFNTNDISELSDVVGVNPLDIMRAAARPRLSVVGDTHNEDLYKDKIENDVAASEDDTAPRESE
ncbi:hypothetical protein IT072_13955 [Leifsonia sp. ZF2019]|uniref:hypothetical protein n=1 Tax=Leifsonia sp. ZF2019 TaxID=2781978 RepID=UPI001CC077C6|nr:hypothetical protein [Leifsonia sp. ZF2019]UAJ78362.1 hypothetical protein IT072_13955 [Leifsonia sp. ZF2019]